MNWVKEVGHAHGPLHGIVHCAGLQLSIPMKTVEHRHFAESMAINVEAGLGLMKGFRNKGAHAEHGAIVIIASIMGLVGMPALTVYCASKGAIIAMTKAAALELAREGLRVNSIAPAYVETDMTERIKASMTLEQFQRIVDAHPLGLGHASDVAHAAAFLLSDGAKWITGTTMVVDGGYSAR